jgi:hypothetical protein
LIPLSVSLQESGIVPVVVVFPVEAVVVVFGIVVDEDDLRVVEDDTSVVDEDDLRVVEDDTTVVVKLTLHPQYPSKIQHLLCDP